MQAEIHNKQLSLLHTILDSDRIEEVLDRQISVDFDNKDSYFYRVLKVLELYNLPDIISLKQQLPTKDSWKEKVYSSIAAYWRESLVRDACESISLSEIHPVWDSTENSVNDVRRVIVKARLLTVACLLQTNIHRFSQY